jgi:hypothetical protein
MFRFTTFKTGIDIQPVALRRGYAPLRSSPQSGFGLSFLHKFQTPYFPVIRRSLIFLLISGDRLCAIPRVGLIGCTTKSFALGCAGKTLTPAGRLLSNMRGFKFVFIFVWGYRRRFAGRRSDCGLRMPYAACNKMVSFYADRFHR